MKGHHNTCQKCLFMLLGVVWKKANHYLELLPHQTHLTIIINFESKMIEINSRIDILS